MMMSTKQSLIHNETIWKSTYLRNFLSLNLVNWSINIETGESCCHVVLNSHFPWHYVKFHDVFHQFCQMCKLPWHFVKFPDNSLTLRNFISPWHFPDGYEPCLCIHRQKHAHFADGTALSRALHEQNSVLKINILICIESKSLMGHATAGTI